MRITLQSASVEPAAGASGRGLLVFSIGVQQQKLVKGVLLLAITVLAWGATFPIGKPAAVAVDAYWLSTIRYAFTGLAFAAILAAVEGRRAFDYEGKLGAAVLVGVIGFAGYNLFAFAGLRRTTPEHAAIITALQAPLTALALWAWRGVRPAAFTLVCVALAFIGVMLVITKGDVAGALAGGSLYGDLLVFIGAASWVAYVLGVVKFAGFSALRYTALTSIPGAIGIFIATAAATALGAAAAPSAQTLASVGWEVAYLTVFTGIVGVLCWNAGIQMLGPLNAVLMGNLIPVVTFLIRIAQGHRFAAIEIAGALLVLGALVANNLFLRRRAAAAAKTS